MSDSGSDPTSPADSFDAILRKVVRGRTSSPSITELAPGTALGGGRFTIEKPIGEGGMGTVYAAIDQTLGRKVAIKVHRAPGGAVRLRREAVAMARLAHPNVVTIFEVGEVGDGADRRLFVVMEYVTGTTLRAWLAETPRSVDEILAVIVAAGSGLAAAHDAGLIHRDIKPDNVLIGSDGRTRVGDFGLAREFDSRDEPPPSEPPRPPPSAADQLLSPMTQTGTVLGTPAYMAPEQARGIEVDGATDQFAFCVTAWEALWGERPFIGASYDELLLALLADPLVPRPPPEIPKVPARVRVALERGLAREPKDRWPSMKALLAELRPPPRRRRLAVGIALGAGVATIGAVALALLASGDSAAACADAAAPKLPNLTPLEPYYATAWRAVCVARAHGAWQPELVAKSEACLAVVKRTGELANGPPPRPVAERARHRVVECADPSYLASSPSVPIDPSARAVIVDARARLQLALGTLTRADRTAVDQELRELESSAAARSPDIAAGIALLRAQRLAFDSRLADSDKLYADAYYAARAIDDADITLAAIAGLIDNATQLRVDHAAADPWLRLGLADAERLRARSPWFAIGMYVTDAQVATQEEDVPRATADLAKARTLLAFEGGDTIEAFQVLRIEADLLASAGKIDEAALAYERALDAATKFGIETGGIVTTLSAYASALASANRGEKALEVAQRAAALVPSMPDDVVADNARINLAVALLFVDADDRAQPLLEQARKNTVARYGERNAIVANIDQNLAVIEGDHGNHEAALVRLRSVLAIEEAELGPNHGDVARVHYSIAASLGKLERTAEALAAARRALEISAVKSPGSVFHRQAQLMVASYATSTDAPDLALALTAEVIPAIDKDPDQMQTLAWAHLERARALLARGRKAEARAEIAIARPQYQVMNMTSRLTELDKLDARAR